MSTLMNAQTFQSRARALPLAAPRAHSSRPLTQRKCRALPPLHKRSRNVQGKAEPVIEAVGERPSLLSRVREFCTNTVGKYVAAVALAAMLVRC